MLSLGTAELSGIPPVTRISQALKVAPLCFVANVVAIRIYRTYQVGLAMSAVPLPQLTMLPPGRFPEIYVTDLPSAFSWCKHAMDRCTQALGVNGVLTGITNRNITFSSSFSGVGTDRVATDFIHGAFGEFLHNHSFDEAAAAKMDHRWAVEIDKSCQNELVRAHPEPDHCIFQDILEFVPDHILADCKIHFKEDSIYNM